MTVEETCSGKICWFHKKLGEGKNAEEEWEDLLPELPDFLVETQILGHVLGTGREFTVKYIVSMRTHFLYTQQS